MIVEYRYRFFWPGLWVFRDEKYRQYFDSSVDDSPYWDSEGIPY